MAVEGPIEVAVELRMTPGEVDALDAVRDGVGALAGRSLDRGSAIVAALELALVRLSEDFELPDDDAGRVRRGLESLRSSWSRGNACLT
jgi:hypothetical protein